MLTDEQINFAIRAVVEWLRALEDNARAPASPADASHSSLLCRLLSGKPLLPKPPPKCFSYPCYELGEGLPVEILGVWENNGVFAELKPDYPVVIDQSLAWRWVDKTAGILEHENGDRFRLWKEEKVRKRLCNGIVTEEPYTATMLQKVPSP